MTIDGELTFQLVRTSNLAISILRKRCRELGLRAGEGRVLECLADRDGQLARDMARSCVLDKSAMTPVLRGMEERGLVRREIVPEDRRASRVFLTERGRELSVQVKAMSAEVSEMLARGLSEEERKNLVGALHNVAHRAEAR